MIQRFTRNDQSQVTVNMGQVRFISPAGTGTILHFSESHAITVVMLHKDVEHLWQLAMGT